MDFTKSLLLIVSLSSLLLSGHAVAPSGSPVDLVMKRAHGNFLQNLFQGAAQQVFSPSQEVVDFCTGTENPTLCAETIAPYHRDSFDPLSALETEMNATLAQSRKVAALIAEFLRDPATKQAAMEALDICHRSYDNMVDTIVEALDLLSQLNVVDAYYKFNSVLSDRSSCEDAFIESPGIENPFAEESQTVYELGGNCLAIMDGLVNNHNQFLV